MFHLLFCSLFSSHPSHLLHLTVKVSNKNEQGTEEENQPILSEH